MNLPVNVSYRELIVKTADQLLIRNITIETRSERNYAYNKSALTNFQTHQI